ncbi:MAG: hypothetical protein DRI44_00750 [Chlamydiae bacterium]|nr:MAG: hypothetical protein DRI44_00750 [Chlamydiota bacterium]
MKKITMLVLITTIMIAANTYSAMTVAQARAQGAHIPVEVGPVYLSTTNDLGGSGYSIFAQDETGGIQLYGPSYIMPDFIVSNNLVPGACLILSGTNSFYQNAYEISYVAVVNNYGVSNVPAVTPIDIDTLATTAPAPALESLEGKLVVITGVDFQESGTFSGGKTYTIWKNGTNGSVRIQDANDHLVGSAIPYGSDIAITGIFSVYGSSYQILPLEIIGPTRDPYLWVEPYPELNFGVVYPNYTRTLQVNIRNGGEANNLDVSGFSSISGDTAKFTPSSIADFSLAPKQETNFSFTYTPGSVGDITNSVMYQFNTTDPSNTVVNFPMYGKSSATPPPTPAVWINEVAYNDPGVDDEEFIELCGVAGTDITGWKVQLVNGFDGSNYYEWTVGNEIGNFVFTNELGGFGFYVLASSSSGDVPNTDETMASDMQNGEDDAVRITKPDGTQIHFFAYNSKSAIDYEYGLPNDLTPLEDSTLASNSLCKVGTGVDEPDFDWKIKLQTPGEINDEQVLPEPIGIGILFLGIAMLLKIREIRVYKF